MRHTTTPGQAPNEALVRFLYAEHGPALLAYATHLTRDRAAAEDIVQETLVRAWRHADELVGRPGSIRGWLLTVARNITTDRIRARAIRAQEVAEGPVDQAVTDDHAQQVVDTMVLAASMRELSPEHRVVIDYIYLRGYSIADTAELLAIPPGTVKSRTYYALRTMRGLLTDAAGKAGGRMAMA
ncbi:sigma-70 family RNA polymerase sigma factor [Actinoplanes sp. NPDC051494]|uniref:sigma-70 family RNA polymerase sigma factor n=1 Tax=Actinoplanes sp. NPDC051494 TaxID=3363907 RepID=UPI0037881A23